MNFRSYRNELAVGLSFLVLLFAYIYKNGQVSSEAEKVFAMKQSVREFKEIIEHKRIWGDKGLGKKIDKLQDIVPSSKITWSKKGKKLTAKYKDLTAKELNKLMTKILSLAVQIIELDISKSSENYNVEFKCKW